MRQHHAVGMPFISGEKEAGQSLGNLDGAINPGRKTEARMKVHLHSSKQGVRPKK